MRIRSRWAAVGVVALLLAGCTSGSSKESTSTTSSGPPTSTPSGTTPSPPTSATVASPTSTPSTPSTTRPAAGTVACTTGDLAVSLSELSAAAGTDFKELAFKNTSPSACTLFGFPGVSFVDAGGHQIGVPVPRAPGTAGAISVAPGSTAAALVAYHDVYVSTTPNCEPTTAAGLRVYPPNNTASVIVPTSLMVCADAATAGTADISPVTTPANLQP
jgi:Protein of unknown function (DUF4232)